MKICSNSFSNTSITKIIFPLSVEEIGEEAFSYYKNLSSILFPIDSKLKAIKCSAFGGVNIRSVGFPSSLEKNSEKLEYDWNLIWYCSDSITKCTCNC